MWEKADSNLTYWYIYLWHSSNRSRLLQICRAKTCSNRQYSSYPSSRLPIHDVFGVIINMFTCGTFQFFQAGYPCMRCEKLISLYLLAILFSPFKHVAQSWWFWSQYQYVYLQYSSGFSSRSPMHDICIVNINMFTCGTFQPFQAGHPWVRCAESIPFVYLW